ncbi:zinc finger protein 567-like [Prorops nasuta]|uniref:zinc finger protein 567-like n=1 Tax=Prorops nasuta TaxID=863751 RepID=UPI0034CD25B3
MDENMKKLCFLCGIVQDHETTIDTYNAVDIRQKIKDTLPISVEDDESTRYICKLCYRNVTFHHKFMQDVIDHRKELGDTSDLNMCLEDSQIDNLDKSDEINKSINDTVYKCPNCNVDLLILLVNNGDEEYSFQISLTMINPPERNQEKKSIRNKSFIYNDKKIENSGTNIIAQDACSDKENSVTIPPKEGLKRKLKDESFPEKEIMKEPKIEVFTYDNDDEFLNYQDVKRLIKIEAEEARRKCKNSDSEYKTDDEINLAHYENAHPIKDNLKTEEGDIYRPSPKIMCDLCGSRYISLNKFQFHMERHKLDEMDKFVCPLCGKEASSENLLWDHYYYTHKSSQRFMCLTCNKLFLKRSRLRTHQKWQKHEGMKEIDIDNGESEVTLDERMRKAIAAKIHGAVSLNCNLCGKLLTDVDPEGINDLVTCSACDDSTLSLMIDGNETKVISPRQYHCSQCPKHFVRKERLEFHEMRHNENMKEFICSTCGKDFRAENSLYEHYMFVHKGARPHICELCGKSFQLKARLKEHHRTHTGERPFQCDICGQRCMTTNALRLHRKIHFSHNRYSCNLCHKTFSKKQNMNEHLEKHWKLDKNITLPHLFSCPICAQDFPTYRMLKYHVAEMHQISDQDPLLLKQKPMYECSTCHQKFKHQMSLKAHRERVHEGKVNPIYNCDACSATFKIKQLLINHIKSKHDGQKRYKCAQCEKGFNDTKSLYNHVLLHTGKKPYVCDYCGLTFRRKDSRDQHHRKHTGEQPYPCQDCGETFSTYNSRAKHRKQEHEEGKSVCSECGEKCIGEKEVRMHLNKHLGEKLEILKHEQLPAE